MNLEGIFPLAGWLKKYRFKDFWADLFAGLTVYIMLIPQGMAYALLAGLPPIYGLYGGLVPLIIYGLLGSSRQLSIGPVAISSLLVLAGLSKIAEPESTQFIELAILAGLLIGIIQLLFSLFRLGFLSTFLSRPVIIGFTSAAAIIISISQLKYLLGFSIPRFDHTYDTLIYALQHIEQTNWLAVLFCVGSMLIMILCRKIAAWLPGALIVTVISILLTYFLRLDQLGLAIVGQVPEGLPHFQLPDITWENIRLVFPTVATVTIIGVVETIGIAKMLEAKNKDTRVKPNQELLAIGVSKIAGAFFQSLPTSASFTRSAVNNEAGARTGIASIFAAIATGLTLIFFTSFFYYLPKAILAAIVFMAVKGLFEFQAAKALWFTYRKDLYMLLVTFLTTLILGIGEGVLAGVILSLLLVIYKASRPHTVVLGQLPDTPYFRNVKRFPQATQFEGILILRFDAPLYFLNANRLRDFIFDNIAQYGKQCELLVLDASSILEIDSSGIETITEIKDSLKQQGIQFYIVGLLGPVRDTFKRAHLIEELGLKNHFLYINDAIEYFRAEESRSSVWSDHAIQHNVKKGK